MRKFFLCLLLSQWALAQPVIRELSAAEADKWARSLNQAAFPGHDGCTSLSHFVRLLRVNGRLHGLALHQANLHSGLCSWTHYLYDGSRWKKVGIGLPDPKDDVSPVLPEPSAQGIRDHFPDLVKGLRLQEWPRSAQLKLLDAGKITELP